MKRILFDNEQEIHQIGEHVSVVWNYDEDKKERTSKEPYIAFLSIRDYKDGPHVRDDSSIAGGIGVGEAEAVIQELTEAVEYIKQLKR